MQQQREEEVKRRLYKTLLATGLALAFIFVLLTFFAPSIGSMFGLISRIGKPRAKEDALAPSPPYFYSTPSVTNQQQIELKGFSEPGSKVVIFVNGPQAGETVADSVGIFTINGISLIDGKNTIFARAEDSYQNQSGQSQTLEITYDIKKPKITITAPKNGATIRNLNQRVSVTGTLDKRCEVRINERLAIVKPDNSFELLLGATEGSMEIKVEAVDEAGNKSSETIKINYVKAGV